MERRGFLKAMLGACAAPAIVKAENIMRIVVPKKEIIVPEFNSLAGSFDRASQTELGGSLHKYYMRPTEMNVYWPEVSKIVEGFKVEMDKRLIARLSDEANVNFEKMKLDTYQLARLAHLRNQQRTQALGFMRGRS